VGFLQSYTMVPDSGRDVERAWGREANLKVEVANGRHMKAVLWTCMWRFKASVFEWQNDRTDSAKRHDDARMRHGSLQQTYGHRFRDGFACVVYDE
jgi:hypothetical protein